MRRITLLTLLFVSLLQADAPSFQQMERWSLDQKIDRVASLEADYSEGSDWSEALKLLHRHLAQNYTGDNWRQSVENDEIRTKIEAIRPEIMDLVYSEVPGERFYGAQFLRYLEVDTEVEESLYLLLEDTDNQKTALDAIFDYDLDTTDLRNELVQGLSQNQEEASQSRFGMKAELWAGRWGLTEAADDLMLLVEENYQKKGKINRTALKSIKELGESAFSLLPRLQSLLERRLSDGDADFREIEALRYAISSVSRGLPKEVEATASNSANSIEGITAPKPAIEEPAGVVVAEPIEKPAEQSSNWWLWLVGLLVVVGGIGLAVRRKS